MRDLTTPPGWYPDPWQQGPLRWWDGGQWTGHVPAPGAGAAPAVDLAAEEGAARRGRWAGWIIAAGQVLGAVMFALMARGGWQMFDYLAEHPESVGIPPGAGTLAGGLAMSIVMSPVSFVGLIFLLVWFHRAVSNGAALGLAAGRAPALAVVSWFIPIVSLWWPYESLRECVPLHAGDTRRQILRWWSLYLLGPFTGMFGSAVAVFSVPAFGVIAVLVVVVAGLFARQTASVIAGVLHAHRALAGTGAVR